MSDLIREAPIGQLIRFVTRRKYLKYPEEKENFQCPSPYEASLSASNVITGSSEIPPAKSDNNSERNEPGTFEPIHAPNDSPKDIDLEKLDTVYEHGEPATRTETEGRSLKKIHTLELQKTSTRAALAQAQTRKDLEDAFAAAAVAHTPTNIQIEPEKLTDGTVLVDWYSTDDPANPQNWSLAKKCFVMLQICLYTMSVYMGSSIYTPSVTGVAEQFGVSTLAASGAGLAAYVFAYGIGPLIWSPMSEVPLIGRNPPYIVTFAIFVILCVPTALSDSYASLLVLRFLQGFFGSPCLATGGATLQDMFSLIKVPYVLSLWAFAATCGPALGPIISGFSVAAENWRWSLWEILWMAGPVWLLMFFFMPETSTSNILLRRARRLREVTGEKNLQSQSEMDQGKLKISNVVIEALWRPNQLMLLDPAIGFTALYTALNYGIFYSFFEVFPLVYIDMYGFNVGEMGLAFLSVSVGVGIALSFYWSYIWWIMEPEIRSKGLGAPERRLIPAIPAAFLEPIGLFIFGWTSRPDIHWIVPTIGIMIFTCGLFIIIQCIFLYLALSYPQYAASLFAGNDFARSSLAAAAILFSPPMFEGIGVGPGCSLLGGCTAGCIVGVFVLWGYGDKLRARSRFAAK